MGSTLFSYLTVKDGNINYFSLLSKQYASNNNPNYSEHD